MDSGWGHFLPLQGSLQPPSEPPSDPSIVLLSVGTSDAGPFPGIPRQALAHRPGPGKGVAPHHQPRRLPCRPPRSKEGQYPEVPGSSISRSLGFPVREAVCQVDVILEETFRSKYPAAFGAACSHGYLAS